MHRAARSLAGGFVAILLTIASARNPLASSRGRQAARATSDTIALDFFALGADGAPIADLKAEEVQVRIDGRPRPVTWLEFVPLADVPAPDPARCGGARRAR